MAISSKYRGDHTETHKEADDKMEVYVITGLMCSLVHYLKVYYLIKKVHDYPIKFSDTNFDASHCLLCLFIYILNSTKPI